MDRVAVFVDAGYFLAAGAALISEGAKQRRHLLTLDEKAAVDLLSDFAVNVSERPLLRIYWYDAAPGGRGTTSEHARLAHCDNVKLRLGFLNSEGQQKGVDSLIVTDLVELARSRSLSDAVLVSGDEDVRIGVQLAQSFGVRVHLLGVKPSRGTQSLQLLQEADTCAEWDVETIQKILAVQTDDAGTGSHMRVFNQIAAPHMRRRVEPRVAGVLDGSLREFLALLTQPEIMNVAAQLSASRNSLSPALDGKLLTRALTLLGRHLDSQERWYLRNRFRMAVKEILRERKS